MVLIIKLINATSNIEAEKVTATDFTAGASPGIDQSITIADNDGVNYHHLTFTSGLLTAYAKDGTP